MKRIFGHKNWTLQGMLGPMHAEMLVDKVGWESGGCVKYVLI